MRTLVAGCLLLFSCAKEPAPAQDPLDYLRVGVDPREEADAIIEQLGRNGFEVIHRYDEPGYTAFDAAHGGDTLVRVVSPRGVALSLEAPDVRWPERLWVELAEEPRLDAGADGQRDVLVTLAERDRVCFGWAEVDANGYAVEVIRLRAEWGESPCVVEILPPGSRVLLEVDVPDAPAQGARVRFPLRANGTAWVVDASNDVASLWEGEAARRREQLEAFDLAGDRGSADRVRAELDWLDRLRNGPAPMLEPADDGEEAR